MKIYNQFTEQFSVNEIAALVKAKGGALGLDVEVQGPYPEINSVSKPNISLLPSLSRLLQVLQPMTLAPRFTSSLLIDTQLCRNADMCDLSVRQTNTQRS